jgi:hypothetical protein
VVWIGVGGVAFAAWVILALWRIERGQRQLLRLAQASQTLIEGERMDLATIQQKVNDLTTVEESAETLLGELSTELKAALANNDQAALQDIADKLDAGKAGLAAAVAANTLTAQPAA